MLDAQGRHASRFKGPGEQDGEDEQPREQNSFDDPAENAFHAVTVTLANSRKFDLWGTYPEELASHSSFCR